MVKLGTDLADPAERLRSVHESMGDGKRTLAQMTPLQILAMSAIGQVPAIVPALFKLGGVGRPAYNLIITQRPGPAHFRTTSTAQSWSATIRCRSRSTGWRSTSPARRTTATWTSA